MQNRYGRAGVVALSLLVPVLACTGSPNPRLDNAPVVRGADGREYRVLAKGPYKAFYDSAGRVDRIEYDSNGDGKTDQTAFYDGSSYPKRLEVDTDFDGRTDRWETYDENGRLASVGISRKHGDRPDMWTFYGPSGETQRVEIDSNGHGRPDRWQRWEGSRLVTEDIDSDGDGKPDRRLKYDSHGKVIGMETLR